MEVGCPSLRDDKVMLTKYRYKYVHVSLCSPQRVRYRRQSSPQVGTVLQQFALEYARDIRLLLYTLART